MQEDIFTCPAKGSPILMIQEDNQA